MWFDDVESSDVTIVFVHNQKVVILQKCTTKNVNTKMIEQTQQNSLQLITLGCIYIKTYQCIDHQIETYTK